MPDEFKKKVMKRVYAIWFVKRMAPALVLYMPFLLAVALWETAREFFVAKIISNFLVALNHGFGSTMSYAVSAITHTRAMPVLIVLSSLAVFSVLLYKVLKSFREVHLARNC